MQNYLTNMMREVDGKVSAIELNGENIIEDCKTVVVYLKKKLSELRTYMEAHPFRNEAEEIDFFKYRKPALLGRFQRNSLHLHRVVRRDAKHTSSAQLNGR